MTRHGTTVEEEDYMTMSLLDSVEAKEKETFVQRFRKENEVCCFPS